MDSISAVDSPEVLPSSAETSTALPSSEHGNMRSPPLPVSLQPETEGSSRSSHGSLSEALRNHSSNIDRLGDLLNRNDSHEKYFARTRSPSDGQDVRWYFGKAPLSPDEAAASVPVAEVVGKSDYFRFSMRDSLALEVAFMEREEELVSAWWKEYAECSEGPIGDAGRGGSVAQKIEVQSLSDDGKNIAQTGSLLCKLGGKSSGSFLYEDEDEIIGIPVKGGLYEVDLWMRRCYPVYWRGEHRRVLRGHWFAQKGGLDWLPLREDISEQLEFAYRSQVWHRRTFQPSGQFAARVDLQGTTQGLHALFTGEDDSWEAWLSIDATGISSVFGLKGSGIKLRRGFAPPESSQLTQDELHQRKEEDMDDYCSQVPVRHLVFMVHGIGQRLENANLVDDVGTFRHIAAILAEQHLTAHQRNTQRVLFIPCQWRRGLKLGGEDAVEKCTLEGVRALRIMLSATVHDILYYMSPVYCQDIINSVSKQLNRLYRKFIKRNLGYNGKVSIYGHSLGSVLSYDILCHQDTLISCIPIDQISSNISQNDDETLPEDKYIDRHGNLDLVLGQCGEQPIVEDCLHCPEAASCNDNLDTNESVVKEMEALRAEVDTLKSKLRAMEVIAVEKRSICGQLPEDHHKHFNDTLYSTEASMKEVVMPDISKSEEEGCSYEVGRASIGGKVNELLDNEIDDDEISDIRQRVDSSEGHSASTATTSSDKVHAYVKPRANSRKKHTPHIEYTKLAFEVDTFFAVGSPLGVFLALRNIRLGIGKGKEYWQDEDIEEEMPACRQMLNIFHPYDPVAYRIEPLVCKEYLNKRPAFVPYHKGGKRLHIGMQEFGEDLSARSKAFISSLGTVGNRMVNVFSASSHEKKVVQHDSGKQKKRSYGNLVMERLTGDSEGRLDYMLQDATFEHQYIQAISSHTSYWRDPDTALFIVKHLYRDIPNEPPKTSIKSSSEITEGSCNLDSGPLKPSHITDEDVAFTFSSKEEVIALMSSLDQENVYM
eukprot:c25495_g1_i1 orf=251-3232(+)